MELGDDGPSHIKFIINCALITVCVYTFVIQYYGVLELFALPSKVLHPEQFTDSVADGSSSVT